MPWNSTWPDGSKSVKGNEASGAQNTTYIETEMQDDHYWNEDSNKDGHHKKVEMPKQALDITLSTSMDGGFYIKDTAEGRAEGFYRNSSGILQYTPSLKSGTVSITSTSTYVTISAIPANVYGEIFIWNGRKIQHGTFISDGSVVEGFSSLLKIQGNTDSRPRLVELANGTDASGLNLRGRRTSGPSGTYTYRILYRDI